MAERVSNRLKGIWDENGPPEKKNPSNTKEDSNEEIKINNNKKHIGHIEKYGKYFSSIDNGNDTGELTSRSF